MKIHAEADHAAGVGGCKVRLLDERSRLVGQIDMTSHCAELSDTIVQRQIAVLIAEAVNASTLARSGVGRPGNVVL